MENKENLFVCLLSFESCFETIVLEKESRTLNLVGYKNPILNRYDFVLSFHFYSEIKQWILRGTAHEIFCRTKNHEKNPLSAFASFFQLFAGCFLFLGHMLSRIVASVLTSYLDVLFVELSINLLLPIKKKPTSWKTLQRCHQHLLSNLSSSENEKQWVITLLVLRTHAIKWELKK